MIKQLNAQYQKQHLKRKKLKIGAGSVENLFRANISKFNGT
jgi:hypothetical protein